ncbi:MAG: methyltransferase family protein [Candidatus Hermodarchaeota archaeon]
MNNARSKFESKIISYSTTISSFLVPIFQYVPCTAIWFGIMSVPLGSYLFLFFQYPSILIYDIQFLIRTPGFIICIFGVGIYIYSLIYQLTHRKQLLRGGPYKVVRHPQYVGFISITLGMTLVAFQTSPIFGVNIYNLNPFLLICLFWIGQVFAYIFLAKIEEIALAKKFGAEFNDYKKSVGFMLPLIKLKR